MEERNLLDGFLDLTWILEKCVPDAGAPAVLERVPLHLVRRRRRPEDEAGREGLPGEVAIVTGLAVRAERQGEGDEPMEEQEEQWRRGRHVGGIRDSEVVGWSLICVGYIYGDRGAEDVIRQPRACNNRAEMAALGLNFEQETVSFLASCTALPRTPRPGDCGDVCWP